MKCTHKTEENARKFVGISVLTFILSMTLWGVIFVLIVAEIFLWLIIVFGISIMLVVLVGWLIGEYNFCNDRGNQ